MPSVLGPLPPSLLRITTPSTVHVVRVQNLHRPEAGSLELDAAAHLNIR